jgi:hypothetical protein
MTSVSVLGNLTNSQSPTSRSPYKQPQATFQKHQSGSPE